MAKKSAAQKSYEAGVLRGAPPLGEAFLVSYGDAKRFLDALEDMRASEVRRHPFVVELIARLDHHVRGPLREAK